jgi:nicotinate-nucleotide adenylyltransferase
MIGIFGGTFDPVHFGHLRPALEVMQSLALSEIRFIPCGQPPHRQMPRASAEDRMAMLSLAIEGQAGFVTDDRELSREGPSYMVDTLESLRQETDQALCLLLGMDAFAGLHQWYRWQSLLSLAHIVVMRRPGMSREHLFQQGELKQLLQQEEVAALQDLSAKTGGKIYFQQVTALDISATAIRQAMTRDESVRYLLPDAVYDYMQQHKLYAQG